MVFALNWGGSFISHDSHISRAFSTSELPGNNFAAMFFAHLFGVYLSHLKPKEKNLNETGGQIPRLLCPVTQA